MLNSWGQLVQLAAPEHTPHPRHPGIVQRRGGSILIRAHHHGTEFQDGKRPVVIPATQRPIKHRPLRRALDRYGDGQHHRKAGKQKNDRQRKIEAPLEHLAVKRMRKRAVPAGQLRLRGVPRPVLFHACGPSLPARGAETPAQIIVSHPGGRSQFFMEIPKNRKRSRKRRRWVAF